jgi:hypothetical protein
MAAESPIQPPAEVPAKKRRRWLRVLLVLAVLLALLGLWLAGPGGRVIGSHVLRGQLEKAGLTGDFTIKSIGANGVTLGKVNLEGPGLIRSIRGETLKVEYRIDELRRGKIRAFNGSDLEIELNLDAAPKRQEDATTPFDAKALGATLRAVQEKLGPVALEGNNVSLHVVRGKREVATIKGADISHIPNTDRFTLKFRTITAVEQPPVGEPAPPPAPDPDQGFLDFGEPLFFLVQDAAEKETQIVPGQEVEIIWTPAGLMIDRIEILPGIFLENLKLNHVAGEPLRTETVVEIDASRVRVRLEDDLRNAQFELVNGPLDVARLMRQFNRDTVLAGTVESLNLTVEDIFKPHGQWRASGTVGATVLRFREWALDGVALKLNKTPGFGDIDLRASLLGTPFTLLGQAQFPPALANDPFRWWHDATFAGTLQTGNIQPAIVEIRRDLNPEPLTIPVPQARLKLDFTANLKGPLMQLVTGDYQLEDVALGERTLPPLTGHAAWDLEGLKVAITAVQKSSTEGEGLNLEGAWDFKTRAYRGAATFARYDLGPLGNFLPAYGIEIPTGILSGSWQGGGAFGKSPTHNGSVSLNESTLHLANRPPLTGSVQGSYLWPGTVELTGLRVTQNGHTLAMAAAWKANQLTLNNVTLSAGDLILLGGSASVPLDPNVRSMNEFLAQQGDIAATLTAANLTFAQVRDLVPALDFRGEGSIFGNLTVSGTLVAPTTDATLEIRSLTATDLPGVAPMDLLAKLHHSDGQLSAESRIVQQDATIFNLEASVPLATSVRSLKDVVTQKGDILFNLQSSRLAIGQIRPLIPKAALPEAGFITSNIVVGGSFATPAITATLAAAGLSGGPLGATPPTDLNITLTSTDSRLNINGTATQPNAPPARLSGSMGFRPQRWLDNPQSIAEETIDLRAQFQGLNARHFTTNLPGVADFSVLLDADVSVTGRLSAPDLRGSLSAREGRLRPKNDSLPTISGLQMNLRFEGRKATLTDLHMTHAGGTLSLRGTADFATLANPVLDLTLTGDQALLWRDDSMNARANAALRLVGPYDAATLSGTLAIVETLYYRDLEVIPASPFRAPRKRAVVARVDQIINPEKAANRWNIPAPLNAWLIDLRILTQDPILLRGDRIGGQIVGDIRAGGTLGTPQLNGTAALSDAKVRLPFSTLEVPRGTITFSPERGFDPIVDLRGTSRISPYDVTIFLSGSASDPEVLLTADPPLPENEILALLATGSTTRDLGTQALTLKAVQLFIEQIRRSRLPFGNQLGEFFGILEEIDIRIGANDPYTGRKLSSASIELSDRLLISVAIDEEGNSRGVLMYLFRFR